MINRNTSKFLNESKKKLKENRFDTLEYLYIDGSYALIRKYEQGPFLKKILNGNVFDRLYRYVSAGKLKTKDNPFNVKNWKVGDDILLGLTSTLPFEDPKNLKKDLQVNFSYCIVFKDAKGYSVKYDAKDFAGNVRGIERYKWQKEVLTAGLFHVDNIEQKGKITYVELSTVKQDKETFIEILRKTREDLRSGEFNKQYPTSLGVKYATYDRLKKLLKGLDLEIFNTNNLSQKEIEAIKKLPKINTYEDLYFFIKEYGLYEDLKPMCTEEPPKEFTKEVWNNTLIENHIGLPEDALPQSRKEAFNEWNCSSPYETKNWPNVTGEYISFQNKLEGMWFIADKYFALKSVKEKLEKDSLKESTRSMRKTLKEFDTSWMDDDVNLRNIKVEDLIEDKYLDKALEYYELFEELTLRGDYKKAEDRSEEDIKKDQRAIQLLKKLQTNTDPALAYGFMLYDESSITKAYWTKRVGDRKDPHTKQPWFKKDKKAEWLYEVYLVLMDQNPKFPDPLYYYKFTDTTGRFNIMNNFKMHWNMYLLPVLSRSIFKRNVNDYKPLGDSKNDFEIKADYSEDDIADFLNVEDFIKYFAKKGPVKTKSGSSLEGLTWKKVLEEIIKNKDERAVKLSKVLGLSAHSVLYKVTDELKKDMKKFDVDLDSFAKYLSKYEDVALNILNGEDVTFSEVGV